ncbi:hypothetical protein J8I87_11225 [Paraburkholderia sp. LEh10]|uniref:hypothetical protein n=1 Tax=Paraburkholderia sp. LEh10 TaxID=2821353 RepID=UPI001AE4E4CE|nr:hypothetical protein [Paraburkholderia sp. LEh10]MBP0590271.1 hypothetical protein [Paraburkholderia sp. LEh10]
MEAERVERIVVALRKAAERERLLTYQRFHTMFSAGDPLTARYDALERAVASLGEVSTIDYGVLLALANGLPGPEFFRRYQRHRYEDYVAVMGPPIRRQSIKRKRMLVEAERRRVYDDAKRKAESHAAEIA